MGTVNPTPSEVLAALLAAGVDVQTYKGWDSIGREWKGPDGSPGLVGAVVHHTATPSATGSAGCPSLWWATNAYELPVCNLLVGRGPGDTYLLAGGSVYHCGDGGPVPNLGINSRGYHGQYALFGIEIDDPGVSTSSLTEYQVEQVGKVLAALTKLTGWTIDQSVLTHKCYTDGCHGVNPDGPSPCVGRKNDTLDGPWGDWPGDNRPAPYNAPFWREKAAAHVAPVVPPRWDGTIPSAAAVLSVHPVKGEFEKAGTANKAAYRVLARLVDLGYADRSAMAGLSGRRALYPTEAVRAFRVANGLGSGDGFSVRVQKRMFGAVKP